MASAAGSLTVLVLAAGKGTRLRSRTIKLLHPVAGRPMLAHVLEAARSLKPDRLVTVIGFVVCSLSSVSISMSRAVSLLAGHG